VSKSSSATSEQPTEREQFWLDHQAAQAASGSTAKEYAASEGLSLQAFYQARKRLRSLGLLAPAPEPAKPRKRRSRAKHVSFAKVAVTPSAMDAQFRLVLRDGIALEWSGDVPESVALLVERLTRRT
jgi:hypothetical protein